MNGMKQQQIITLFSIKGKKEKESEVFNPVVNTFWPGLKAQLCTQPVP